MFNFDLMYNPDVHLGQPGPPQARGHQVVPAELTVYRSVVQEVHQDQRQHKEPVDPHPDHGRVVTGRKPRSALKEN